MEFLEVLRSEFTKNNQNSRGHMLPSGYVRINRIRAKINTELAATY